MDLLIFDLSLAVRSGVLHPNVHAGDVREDVHVPGVGGRPGVVYVGGLRHVDPHSRRHQGHKARRAHSTCKSLFFPFFFFSPEQSFQEFS